MKNEKRKRKEEKEGKTVNTMTRPGRRKEEDRCERREKIEEKENGRKEEESLFYSFSVMMM